MSLHQQLTATDIDGDSAGARERWTVMSSGLFLLVTCVYWLGAWLIAGLPPLVLLAARGVSSHQSARDSRKGVEATQSR